MLAHNKLIDVARYSGESKEEFTYLFSNYSFGRFCSDWSLDINVSRKLEQDRLFDYIQTNPDTSWVAKQGKNIVGIIGARKSVWDTNFWGVNYFNINHIITHGVDHENTSEILSALIRVVEKWLQAEGANFVSARADVYDLSTIHALESAGFRYIETTITNSYPLKGLDPTPDEGYCIRLPRPDETDQLMAMTQTSFITHRFYADKHFPTQKVDEMYREWVRNSLESPSWKTLLLEQENKVRGLFIMRTEDLSSYFGLSITTFRMATISPGELGKGYGMNLFMGVMKHLCSEADIIDSGLTIRNIRSFNIHTKLGFRLLCSSGTFHKWY
jgi:hypothetical protein